MRLRRHSWRESDLRAIVVEDSSIVHHAGIVPRPAKHVHSYTRPCVIVCDHTAVFEHDLTPQDSFDHKRHEDHERTTRRIRAKPRLERKDVLESFGEGRAFVPLPGCVFDAWPHTGESRNTLRGQHTVPLPMRCNADSGRGTACRPRHAPPDAALNRLGYHHDPKLRTRFSCSWCNSWRILTRSKYKVSLFDS